MPGARPVKPRDGDYGRQGRAPWLDVDWQAAQHRLEIDGREVNYCELGEGPAILFVHGLGASWQSWLEQLPEAGIDFAEYREKLSVQEPGINHQRCFSGSGFYPATGGQSDHPIVTALDTDEIFTLHRSQRALDAGNQFFVVRR